MERVSTGDEFNRWLLNAKAGDRVIYGTAVCVRDQRGCSAGDVAREALFASGKGFVHLTQKRTGKTDITGANFYDYIATRAS